MKAILIMMIVDFHTHIFPKQIRTKRENYFSSEPEFELLYNRSEAKMAGAGSLVEVMDEQRVDVAVIFGFPWKNSNTFKRHNDYILEAVEKYSGRLVGFSCFDYFNEEAVDEATRCLNSGLVGIGELAVYQTGIDELSVRKLEPFMDICREQNRPVLFHTNESVGYTYPGKAPMSLNQVYALIKRFPDNTIVLAHWGGGIFFFNLAKKEVKESLKNVYFDTAASPFIYDSDIYRIALQVIDREKILLGSDFPTLNPDRYFEELKVSGISPSEIESICGGNAARLLNL
jgi:predicted TIM-barrel fold metal-dependent hydrolase